MARKARPLPGAEPSKAKPRRPKKQPYNARVSEARRTAKYEYMMDRNGVAIVDLYRREDRPYHKLVSDTTFRRWAQEDAWHESRQGFWADVERAAIEQHFETQVREETEKLAKLRESREALMEYVLPQRDEDGEIKRYPATKSVREYDKNTQSYLEYEIDHPLAGLPVFPNVDTLPYDKIVGLFIEVDNHIRVAEGKVTERTETMNLHAHAHVHEVRRIETPRLTDEEISELARLRLYAKQPELAANNDVIDGEVEDDGEDR